MNRMAAQLRRVLDTWGLASVDGDGTFCDTVRKVPRGVALVGSLYRAARTASDEDRLALLALFEATLRPFLR